MLCNMQQNKRRVSNVSVGQLIHCYKYKVASCAQNILLTLNTAVAYKYSATNTEPMTTHTGLGALHFRMCPIVVILVIRNYYTHN